MHAHKPRRLKCLRPHKDRIAGLCGYSSLASFSNFIRAETGLSPSAWRERG